MLKANMEIGWIKMEARGETPSEVFLAIQSEQDLMCLVRQAEMFGEADKGQKLMVLIDCNNMHDFDTFIFYKWVLKTFIAVTIVTNTWNIVMGVFDVAQHVVNQAAGVIIGDTALDVSTLITNMEQRLMEMDIGPLFGLWFQSSLMGIIAWVLSICIFIMSFVTMIVAANELEAGKPYRLNGVYREDRNLITFSVGQVTP